MSRDAVVLLALALVLPIEYLLRRKVLTTRDRRRILWRAVGAAASAAAGLIMASAVDNGTTRVWAPAAQVAWGITLISAVFAAVFLFAQAVALARGGELPFLRDPTESPRSRRAFRWIVIVGIALIVVVLVAGTTSLVRAQLATASIGLLSILLGILRPGGFWDSPILTRWRSNLGDTMVTLIYIGVGLAVIIGALTTHLE